MHDKRSCLPPYNLLNLSLGLVNKYSANEANRSLTALSAPPITDITKPWCTIHLLAVSIVIRGEQAQLCGIEFQVVLQYGLDHVSQMCTFLGLPLTVTAYKWNQMDPVGFIWFHLYAVRVNRPLWFNSDPSKGTHRVPGIHFVNHCVRKKILTLNVHFKAAESVNF